jgi:hypothetical protein
MSEFINVLEADKLPLNAIDRFIGIDTDGNIKTATVVIDNFMDDLSTNAIANKVVTTAIQEMQETIGNIDVMLLEIIG